MNEAEGGGLFPRPQTVTEEQEAATIMKHHREIPTSHLGHARRLRRNMTDTERFVWKRLRGRRFAAHKFRRQVPIGPLIADFACLETRLILELDGGQHREQADYDRRRSDWLESQGFRVLRFWDHEALQEWETVEEVIWRAIEERQPRLQPPLPQRERGRYEEQPTEKE